MMTKKTNLHLCIKLFGRNRLARSAVNPKVGGLSPLRSENSRTTESDFLQKIRALNYQFKNRSTKLSILTLEFDKIGL